MSWSSAILGAPSIFWEEGRQEPTFFATYVCHGNAGSFINLVLPVIAVLTGNAFRPSGSDLERAVCVPALLVTVAGAFVNVSKAAMLITGGLLLALTLWQAPRIRQAWHEGARAHALAGAGAVVLALLVLVAAGGWQMARNRWARIAPATPGQPARHGHADHAGHGSRFRLVGLRPRHLRNCFPALQQSGR